MGKRSGGSNGGGTGTGLTLTDSSNSTYYIAGSGSYFLNSRGKKSSVGNATANNDAITLGTGNDTVFGLGGNDTVSGGGGNDRLYGEAGQDSLDGGAGNDLIVGGAGNDSITGGDDVDTVSYHYASKGVTVDLGGLLPSSTFNAIVDSNDSDVLGGLENIIGSDYSDVLTGDLNGNLIDGGGGADTINGADGDDTLRGANGRDSIEGGAGNDSISGDNSGAGDTDGDWLFGGSGNDTIFGNNGSDYIDGGEDADYLDGGNGSDTIVYDANDDSVNGGDGTDTLDASSSTAGVTIDLSSIGGKFSNFEIVIGSDSLDDLTGDDGDNLINGGDGNDLIDGNDGADTLVGGVGEDSIDGGAGIDTVDYSSADIAPSITLLGPDDTGITLTLSGATVALVTPGDTDVGEDEVVNVENIIGTSAKDTLTGDSENNLISAGAGDDTVAGGDGLDTLYGGDGNDQLTVDDSDTVVDGGDGSDVLKLAADAEFDADELANVETATATADGADLTVASADVKGTNNIASFSGFTGSGTAVEQLIVVGTSSADTLDYSTGLTITDGQLVVNAGDGNDTVTGTSGADLLNGEADNDTIDGGAGADEIDGGAGNDTYVASAQTNSAVTTAAGTNARAAGIDEVTVTGGDIFDFSSVTAIIDIDAGGSSLAATIGAGSESTGTDLLSALNAAISLAAVTSVDAGDAFLVTVTDDSTDTTADGDFDGTYLVVAGGSTIDASAYIVQLVGAASISATSGDIVIA